MNTEKQVVEILKEVVEYLPSDYKNINLLESGIIDSFSIIQFITVLSGRYNIEIDIDDVNTENFASVDTILNMLSKYIDRRAK